MPVSDGRDEVASLRKQLRHQQEAHREMQTMLQNQVLAIQTFQSKLQMAGQQAHAFVAKTRAQSEDFARAELMAAHRFKDSLQHQYDGQLRSHAHALQDECRDHVGQEEDELHKELQQALTQESSMCRDQLHQTLRRQICQEEYADEVSAKEINGLRLQVPEQERAFSHQQEEYAHKQRTLCSTSLTVLSRTRILQSPDLEARTGEPQETSLS